MKDDNKLFQRTLQSRARNQPRMSILVVDDDPSILQLLETALVALENFNVSVADSAGKALGMIETADAPFDCLLLDIQMPETDGISLLRKIRALENYSDTPIIMLTAMSERTYIDDAFVAGATDYVTKPFDLIDLRGRLNAARRLVKERRKAQETQRKVTILAEELRKNTQFNFDDPLVIDGVDRHLRFAEFDNYIDKLPRGQIFKSHAMAILLQDAHTLFATTDCSYFRHVINSIALCLQSESGDLDWMFSYRGGGMFLAIVHDEQSLRAIPSEQKLNETIHAMLGERDRADSLVQVVLSEPCPMRTLSRSGVRTAINRAISSAQSRETMAGLGDARPANADYDAGEKTEGQSRRRLYERVLLELYAEDNYLNTKSRV